MFNVFLKFDFIFEKKYFIRYTSAVIYLEKYTQKKEFLLCKQKKIEIRGKKYTYRKLHENDKRYYFMMFKKHIDFIFQL